MKVAASFQECSHECHKLELCVILIFVCFSKIINSSNINSHLTAFKLRHNVIWQITRNVTFYLGWRNYSPFRLSRYISEYSFACFACCRELCLSHSRLLCSFNFIFTPALFGNAPWTVIQTLFVTWWITFSLKRSDLRGWLGLNISYLLTFFFKSFFRKRNVSQWWNFHLFGEKLTGEKR